MDRAVPPPLEFVASHLAELPFGRLRVKTGVYFLIHRDRVVYVGMTETGAARPMSHLGKIPFDRALFLPSTKEERRGLFRLADVELAFIHRLNPPLNGTGKTGPAKSYTKTYLDLDAFYGDRRDEELARWQKRRDDLHEEWVRRYADGGPMTDKQRAKIAENHARVHAAQVAYEERLKQQLGL